MSTTLKARTLQQRAVQATGHLREILQLEDLKLLSTALAEVAADEAERNPSFARRVRDTYSELISLHATRPLRQGKTSTPDVHLVPLPGAKMEEYDPYAPLDAYLLLSLYGPGQLRMALTAYSLAKLKQALPAIEQRNPSTKPSNKARKDSIIDYIVEHVAGPGY